MAESKFPWISKKKHGTSKAFHAELILVCTMATTRGLRTPCVLPYSITLGLLLSVT